MFCTQNLAMMWLPRKAIRNKNWLQFIYFFLSLQKNRNLFFAKAEKWKLGKCHMIHKVGWSLSLSFISLRRVFCNYWMYHDGTPLSLTRIYTWMNTHTRHTLKPCSVGCECSVSGYEKYHWHSHTLLPQAASRTDTHTRCRVCPELRGNTARGKSQCGK